MKKTQRFAALICAVLLCVSAVGCSSEKKKDGVDTLRYKDVSYAADAEKVANGVVCENDTWQLMWNNSTKQVTFIEKATGAEWGTTPSEATQPQTDANGFMVKNHAQVESALQVYYHNPSNQAEEIAMSSTDAVQDGDIYLQKIDNGLRVYYDFVGYEFIVPVDYTISDGYFNVAVQPELIADNKDEYVTGFALAPFACGLKNDVNEGNWLFYPDGSGALFDAKATATVGDNNMVGVYGEDLSVEQYDFTTVKQQVNMPVFGVKKNDVALLGIIDSGVEGSSMAYNVGSKTIGYSTVYPSFAIRTYNSLSAPRGFSSPAAYIKVFADYINTTPCSVRYYALSGADANLTGMANTYRNYLTENRGLQESALDETSASFKYVGGTRQPDFVVGLPSSKLYPLTTTEQAATMTTELVDAIGSDIYVDMYGFGSSGADTGKLAGNFSVGKTLGGKAGMKDFASSMEKLGVDWYMDFDLITIQASGNGFSQKGDTAVWSNKQVAYFHGFNPMTRNTDGTRYYILKRNQLEKAAKTLLKKVDALGVKGISLNTLSNIKYSDCTTGETGVCAGMAKQASDIFSDVKSKGYSTLADGANDYAAAVSDRVIDAPLYSSQYDFAIGTVPFYELVFKGYIPMTSVSLNLCADGNDALLRCVETGIAPGYTLTYNYDNELVTSTHSFIFGSGYEGNKAVIAEQVNSVKDYLATVKGAKVSNYTWLNDDVRITVFDNGVYTVVNYGETEASTDYGTVAAKSWITGRV